MSYNHGVRVLENPTSLTAPINGTAGLQVIFGTAPVNLAKDPYATCAPVIAHSFAEAVEQLGYCEDYAHYTLCQSMDASFKVLNVAPIILVNVLDPKKHKKVNEVATVTVKNLMAVTTLVGVLLDTVIVKKEGTPLEKGTDYELSFGEEGQLEIMLTASGAGAEATELTVESTSIDPTAVAAEDIIGGYDAESGIETGMELVRQVFPKFNMTPGLLLAPGWSHIPEVGIALGAKCEEINGTFTCEAVIDLDSTASGADKYTEAKTVKEASGFSNKHTVVLWPKVKVGEKVFYYSAIYAALVAYTDAQNGDVPNLPTSNKLLAVSATVTADGTEVLLDQTQANVLNGAGIVTAINVNGWRTWGNNTAAYPGTTDPKDRWFNCRRFFSWWGNSFILSYFQNVDDPANYRLIESIMDAENIKGNSLVAQGRCAAARITFSEAENPITDIIDGKITFHQYLAPYTPAENITNVLEFDPNALASALNGGE